MEGASVGSKQANLLIIQKENSHQFLKRLDNDLFSHVGTYVLSLEQLPSQYKIFNTVQQEENQKEDDD